MTAKQKHRTAGNSYNLRRKVEIPIEVQLQSHNEFASQPEPGQSSKSRSDTESDTSIGLELHTLVTQESKDSFEESPVLCLKKKYKKSDKPSKVLEIERMWGWGAKVPHISLLQFLVKKYFLFVPIKCYWLTSDLLTKFSR